MRRIKLTILSIFTAASLGLFMSSLPVLAIDPFAEVCTEATSGGTPTVCKEPQQTTNPVSGGDGVLLKAVKLLRVVGGAGAMIMIIFSGLRLVISNGDAGAFKKTRENILYASVGLVVVMIAPEIIKFIINWTTP